MSQLQTSFAAINARPNGSHANETGISRVLEDLIEVIGQLSAGQMSVCIKKRHRSTFDLFFVLALLRSKTYPALRFVKPKAWKAMGSGKTSETILN